MYIIHVPMHVCTTFKSVKNRLGEVTYIGSEKQCFKWQVLIYDDSNIFLLLSIISFVFGSKCSP